MPLVTLVTIAITMSFAISYPRAIVIAYRAGGEPVRNVVGFQHHFPSCMGKLGKVSFLSYSLSKF
jgi:hypothetical protein